MKIITSTILAVSLAVALPAHAQFFQQSTTIDHMQPMFPPMIQQSPTVHQQPPMIQNFTIQPGIGQPTINCTQVNLSDTFKSINCM